MLCLVFIVVYVFMSSNYSKCVIIMSISSQVHFPPTLSHFPENPFDQTTLFTGPWLSYTLHNLNPHWFLSVAWNCKIHRDFPLGKLRCAILELSRLPSFLELHKSCLKLDLNCECHKISHQASSLPTRTLHCIDNSTYFSSQNYAEMSPKCPPSSGTHWS